MGNKEKILELLSQENLTSEELANKSGLTENEVRVYLNRLRKLNKIRVIDKKERFKVYAIMKTIDSKKLAKIQDLKFILSKLYYLIKFKYQVKPELYLTQEDQNLLDQIKAIIEEDDFIIHGNNKVDPGNKKNSEIS